MKKTITQFFLLLTINSSVVFAHGEDKLGPNGGFVRMPGAFHTEIVPTSSNELKVFLLDMEWKNPSVLNSSVELTFSETKAKCEIKENYFLCEFPKTMDLTKKGKIKLLSQREKLKGNSVIYELPLSLKKETDPHSGHH